MKGRWLRENRRTTTPERFIVFDTETIAESDDGRRERHRAFLAVAALYTRSRKGGYGRREEKAFTNMRKLERWILQQRRRGKTTWVFAHNIEFDLLSSGLYARLRRRFPEAPPPVVGDRVFIWRLRTPEGTLLFCDSMNFFPLSLAEAAAFVGMEKLPMPGREASMEAWIAYCRRDVEIVAALMQRFIALHRAEDWGRFMPTLGGIALNLFRHKFLRPRDLFIHDHPALLDLERRAYYGGRAEAWWLGEVQEEVFDLDVNSMYPFLMRDLYVPTRPIGLFYDLTPKALARALERYEAIAEVEVETKTPALPVRAGEGTCWPVGRFVTVLAGPELRLAFRLGAVRRVVRAALYERKAVFRAWADYILGLRARARADGDGVLEMIIKRLANILHGKLGEWGRERITIQDPKAVPRYGRDVVRDEEGRVSEEWWFEGQILHVARRTKKTFHTSVAAAATITAAARAFLWALVVEAGLENVLYMDTDGLLVTREGFERLRGRIGEGPGQLKVVGRYNSVCIFGPKDIIGDRLFVRRGIPRPLKLLGPGVAEVLIARHIPALARRGEVDGAVLERRTVRSSFHSWPRVAVSIPGPTRPPQLDGGCPDGEAPPPWEEVLPGDGDWSI